VYALAGPAAAADQFTLDRAADSIGPGQALVAAAKGRRLKATLKLTITSPGGKADRIVTPSVVVG
jgi:hypothetical protein